MLHCVAGLENNEVMAHPYYRRGLGPVLSFGLLFGLLYAQMTESVPVDVCRGAASLTRWLHALKTRASLILITAHPDDEDGGMLALETRGAGVRATLFRSEERRVRERV